MAENANGGGMVLKWAHLVVVLVVQVFAMGAVWASVSFQVADHTRRIELIEKRMDERSVARDEYERRHEDLIKQVEELRVEIKELQRKVR